MRWGQPEPAMLRFARRTGAPLLPVTAVINARRDDPLFESGASVGAFYAQSWALAHALLLGRHGVRLEDLGEATPESLAELLGLRSAESLDGHLRDYLHARRHASAGTSAPLQAAAPVDARVEAAAPDEVSAARGLLAMAAGSRGDLAEVAAAR